MRLRKLLLVVAAALVSSTRAAAAEPVAAQAPAAGAPAAGAGPAQAAPPGVAPGQVAPVAPTPVAGTAAAEPTWSRAYVGTVGLGYYERLHLGAAWQPSPRSSLGIFAGTDVDLGDTSTWDVGLAYGHAVGRGFRGLETGWNAKALYWSQSSPDYDWKMMSVIAGAYLAKEVRPGMTLALDGGVALSFSLDTVRKQNVNYEYPNRWNGSVCLELRYRFDEW